MKVSGVVLAKPEPNAGKKYPDRLYYAVKIVDDTLRTNEGVLSVDVDEAQYRAAEVGQRVEYTLSRCEYRELIFRIAYSAAPEAAEA